MTELHTDQPTAAPEPAARPPRRARRPRRLALTAAAAGALAAAAVTASAAGLPGHSRPAPGSGHITAAHLLSKIADAAARAKPQDVSDSQFEYIASQVSAGTNEGAAPEQTHLRQVWLPVADLCGPGLLIENGQRSSLSEKDGAAVPVGGGSDNAQRTSMPGKKVRAARSGGGSGTSWESAPPVQCPISGSLGDPTYRFLQTLPTDPHALLDYIYARVHNPGQADGAFTTIADTLRESIPPPSVAAAFYRAAALIPGVTVVPDAQDALGRPGVAVSFTSDAGVQSEWIFDKDTLKWLGERMYIDGKLVFKTAITDRAIVDHPGEIPPAASSPAH
jgi:hypothetical protein